jgi:NADH-quinone oxidoreductase subunit C
MCEKRMTNKLVELVKSKFPNAVQDTIEFRGETTIVVPREAVVDVCTFLRDEPDARFDFLSDLSAADHYPEEPRFNVNLQLYSMEHNHSLRVKVRLNGGDAVMPSLTGVWPGANWHEREVWDLMGVKFTGHPDPRRIFLPEDYLGHPLRRDAPIVYEEPQFTHNFEEIDRSKPYAKE